MSDTTTRVIPMTFFKAADAPTMEDDGIMTYAPSQTEPEVFEEMDLGQLVAGQKVNVLFKGEGPGAFSLLHATFGPGFRLPRHSHDADCLYYVLSGEARMGTRVLGPGDGFFVTADTQYAYSAGPEGAEVLEFRTATGFDIKVRDKTIEQWRPVIEAVRGNGHLWANATPADSSANS
jgi:quercetin dioxygenase-like cupin family protein